MAWPKESRRHGLARKGIPTVIDGGRRFDVSNFVARGKIKGWDRVQHEQDFTTWEKIEGGIQIEIVQVIDTHKIGAMHDPRYRFKVSKLDERGVLVFFTDELFKTKKGAMDRAIEYMKENQNFVASGQKEINFSKGFLSKRDIRILINAYNEGNRIVPDELDQIWNEGMDITPEQVEQGKNFLIKNRKKFAGFRENAILDDLNTIRFNGIHNIARYKQPPRYTPNWRVIGDDGNTFDYDFYDGKVHITG